jgi:chaperonin GroES
MAHGTKTTLRPLHDRILVKRLAEGDEKHGSIIIPDSAKEKPQEGKVIAVGTGKVTKLDGQEYLTMREEDVLGILSA